jgi:hypothetical protein
MCSGGDGLRAWIAELVGLDVGSSSLVVFFLFLPLGEGEGFAQNESGQGAFESLGAFKGCR